VSRLPTCLLPIVSFSYIYISQGSVATQLRCGEIFNKHFTANCPQSVPVKEFWKSINIWRKYGQRKVGIFSRHSVLLLLLHLLLLLLQLPLDIPVQPSSSEASGQSTTPLHTELLLRHRRSGRQYRPPDRSHAPGNTSTPPADAICTNTHTATTAVDVRTHLLRLGS